MNRTDRDRAIAAFRADPYRSERRTPFYGFIKPRAGGEFTVTVYAVNETKRHGIRVAEVNRAWSDRPYYRAKDLWRNVWGGLMVEFDEAKHRPHLSFDWYGGKWGARTRWERRKNLWWVDGVRLVNPAALQATRYRYAAFPHYSGAMPLVPYCQLWKRFPEVEILAKAGLPQFIDEPFLERLARNESLRNFFRAHVREIRAAAQPFTPAEVIRAHAHGWTLARAKEEQFLRYGMRDIPEGVDRRALARYIARNDIDLADWRGYAADLARAGRDVAGGAFPRDFHAARRRVQAAIRKLEARTNAEREAALAKMAKSINAALARMRRRLMARANGLTAIFPTTRKEFMEEGRAMRNCIAGYFSACAAGKTICFFVRKDGERVADVEATKAGKVVQCRAKFNKRTAPEVEKFAAYVAKPIAAAARRTA